MARVMESTTNSIKTRLLIISDTHGQSFQPGREAPRKYADVAIHCGDLTDGSKLSEFRQAIDLLQALNAPLKLVIAGNHDFTLDLPTFEWKIAEVHPPLDPELVAREYGTPGEARRLIEETSGITFLDEGTHSFVLDNGARLTVYASPWTCCPGTWDFQYHPNQGQEFKINNNIDIAITHGPPKGVMDYTSNRDRAGCPNLFAAIARARPRLHCFGHIHEGWGAKLVTWKNTPLDFPTHFTAIDNAKSTVVETLARLRRSTFDSDQDFKEKERRKLLYETQGCCLTTHCAGDEHPIIRGEQTLFINAAYTGYDELPVQWPWLVELELAAAE